MNPLFFLYNNKNQKKESNIEFEANEEIIKSMCILSNMYIAIGKNDGYIIIYDINNKNKIYNNKIFDNSISCLLTSKDQSCFFSCSESTIKYFSLISDINLLYKSKYILKEIKNIKIHDSIITKLEYLDDDIYASCSMDSSFIIWKFKNNNINILLKLKDQSNGLVYFLLEKENNLFNNLVTLNKKGTLSFYKIFTEQNYKSTLKKVILNIDYTNSNSIQKIENDIFIGGYNYLQVISIKNMQIQTTIKIKSPISYIYKSINNFLVLGLKNGSLKFMTEKYFHNLNEKDIQELEKNYIGFHFSILFKNGEAKIFDDDKSIIKFIILDSRFICISDESIKILKNKQDEITLKTSNKLPSISIFTDTKNYFSNLINNI